MLSVVLLFMRVILGVTFSLPLEIPNDEKNVGSKVCPYGIESSVFGDSNCYIFHKLPLTFYNAEGYCEGFGGRLAIVPNGDVNQFISGKFVFKVFPTRTRNFQKPQKLPSVPRAKQITGLELKVWLIRISGNGLMDIHSLDSPTGWPGNLWTRRKSDVWAPKSGAENGSQQFVTLKNRPSAPIPEDGFLRSDEIILFKIVNN